MSNKHNLVLYVDQELVEKSRNLGFNLSKTFENYLKQLLTQFSQVNSSNNIRNNDNICGWWAGPDLNRRPSARQADVLTELDYRPTGLVYFLFLYIATSSLSLYRTYSKPASISLPSSSKFLAFARWFVHFQERALAL
jgi:hypothetical protein